MAVAVEGVDMALVPFGEPGLTSKRYFSAKASETGTSTRRPKGEPRRRIGCVWSIGAQKMRLLRAVTRARGEREPLSQAWPARGQCWKGVFRRLLANAWA